METSKDSEWNFNYAPGYATGSMAGPGVVLCCNCGGSIPTTEDCYDRMVQEPDGSGEYISYICRSCFKERLG